MSATKLRQIMFIFAILLSASASAQVDTIRIKRTTVIIVEDTSLAPFMDSNFPEVGGVPYTVSFVPTSSIGSGCVSCPKPADTFFSRFARTIASVAYTVTLYPFPGKQCGTYTLVKK